MQDIQKLKIGTLISAAFAVLGILIVLMGGSALLKVDEVDRDFDLVMQDRYPKIASLQTISTNLQVVARAQRDLMLLTDS
ncbi:MAG: hypothetical protein CFE44_18680, partial [Burkholderiales bacterium PBB4]